MTLKFPSLYAITDPKLLPEQKFLGACEQAFSAGLKLIQYRNKGAGHAFKKLQICALLELAKVFNAQVIVNDDLELALECQADGVHLGQEDGSISDARNQTGDHFIIGATCHNKIHLASQAAEFGASYVAFGRFFPSKTKSTAAKADFDSLQEFSHTRDIPVVAIGGINQENALALRGHGVKSIAVCHAIFGTTDIKSATRSLLQVADVITQ